MTQQQRRFPHPAEGFAWAAGDVPVLLNGMRVEFAERVPLYPVDLEQVPAGPPPTAGGSTGDGHR